MRGVAHKHELSLSDMSIFFLQDLMIRKFLVYYRQ